MDAIPIGSIIGKVWGTTQAVFKNETCQVELLRLKKGFKCSQHKHGFKMNLFHVVSGKLRIRTLKDGLEDETVLTAGQSTTVKPGDRHRFEVLVPSIVLEIYWVRLSCEDIMRDDTGGKILVAPRRKRRVGTKA